MTEANFPGPTERLLGAASATLFLVALLTGLFAGAAMSGHLHVDPHAALAAHLNALMGTFLLGSFGWTLPMLRYGAVGKRRLAWILVASSFANWAVTTTKAVLLVSGLEPSGSGANDMIFVLLQVTVVLPGIGAAVAWVLGFRAR
jgi:hydroxylaminobenzene mutase